jgi:hypothetical protein
MIRRVLKFLKWKKLIFGVGGILDILYVPLITQQLAAWAGVGLVN